MSTGSHTSNLRRFFVYCTFASLGLSSSIYIAFHASPHSFFSIFVQADHYRRPECSCSRPALPFNRTNTTSHLCSPYATRRGPNQRVIGISLFGPKENRMFQVNRSLTFLHELINDMNLIYPDGFILRVHHDQTIGLSDIVCPIECANPNVDFCSMDSKLFIPPKIWRFIPAGDPLVDISERSHPDESRHTFRCSDEPRSGLGVDTARTLRCERLARVEQVIPRHA